MATGSTLLQIINVVCVCVCVCVCVIICTGSRGNGSVAMVTMASQYKKRKVARPL